MMAATACGLDFGTSNSTLGLVDATGAPQLVPLEAGELTIPSVLFFNFDDDQLYFGRQALSEYVSGADGRIMRSIKSLLGSSLMEDQTRIKARRIPFTEVLGLFLGELTRRAETANGARVENVVVGRPVHFVDYDPVADREAESQLHRAVMAQGFRNIEFQFEPIAAALDYERQITSEQLAMVADIGGGTSDFTIVRLSPERARKIDRQADILATAGVHVGGTDFDRILSMAEIMPLLGLHTHTRTGGRSLPLGPYFDLATWHRINRLYTRAAATTLHEIRREAIETGMVDKLIAIVEGRLGHLLAARVEQVKIDLTDAEAAPLAFGDTGIELGKMIARADFEAAIAETAERIPAKMRETLHVANVRADDIQTIIMTGGSTQIRQVRRSLDNLFPSARFVQTDAFGSVGLGLTIDAQRRFG